MDKSQLPKLKRTVRHVVQNASEPGGEIDAATFTFATARAEVTRIMGFDEGALDGQWKKVVKEEVNQALEALNDGDDSGEGSSKSPSPPRKKPSSKSAPSSKSKPLPKAKPDSNPYLRYNDASDEDQVEERTHSSSNNQPPRKPERQSPVAKVTVPKSKKRERSPSESEIDRSSDDHTSRKRKSSEMKGRKGDSAKKRAKSPIEIDEDSDAQSDLSIVFDDPPKAKKKRSSGGNESGGRKKAANESKGKTTRAKKDPNEGLSPDEARVADLKRIVVACGVRKQWTKEFSDAPNTKSQTSILLRMLKDLGMDGKPTLAKAKSIKEARELASELNDIQQFEATRGRSAGERQSRAKKASKAVEAESDEDDEEPAEKGAADAVMAFLQDEESD